MSSDFNVLSKRLADAIRYSNGKKTTAYDTSADVVRVKDGIAYVHIAGGVDETPVALTINAKEGDNVQLRVSGGRAWLTGNLSSPPTDDTLAQTAKQMAESATQSAIVASRAAVSAVESATQAKSAANQAISDAADAALAADNAQDSADAAQDAADAAQDAADAAQADATDAKTSAQSASRDAASALASATSASTSASKALVGLSQVQSVLDVLNWIAKHGVYAKTLDVAIVPGKTYYTVTGTAVANPSNDDVATYYELSSGVYSLTQDTSVVSGKTYYSLVGTPVGSPDVADIGTYYELTINQAVASYVMTHLAVTNDGLWVLNSSSGYKLLVASTGVIIYDPSGNAVATFGESITFGSTRPQYIGGENAYIVYYDSDDDGIPDSINIGGSNILMNNTASLSEVLSTITTAQEASEQSHQNAVDISEQRSRFDNLYQEIRLAVLELANSNTIFTGDALEDYTSDEVPTFDNYPTFTDFFIWDKCSTSLYCADNLICGTNNYANHVNEIVLNTVYNNYYQFRYDSTEQEYSWDQMTAAEVEALSNKYSYISVENELITLKSSKNNQSSQLLIAPSGITPSLIYCC